MSHKITVEGGKSVRLKTAGKYCDRDIVVTAEGGTEDLNDVLTEQEALIAEMETAITALEAELEGKASGGSGGVATCTIEIVNETLGSSMKSSVIELWFIAYENGECKGYGGNANSLVPSIVPPDFDWYAEKNTLNNVVCGSMICIKDALGNIESSMDYVNMVLDPCYLIVPPTPNATHVIKLTSSPWG